ncbi:MAG: hypothetical protein A3F43_03200 [Gammaproteobacteria bacterium RIFCSPHIGHO2_12_FULL_42_10]|nr:MAG: hypothetical protein A3F43_03200 [Gammaproteobacteria bacterium RIFCSPHIGHO2_12_FULL_42_10]
MGEQIPGFIDFFKQVPDHRIERHKLHVVEEILLVAFCGVIAGCDGWDDNEGALYLDHNSWKKMNAAFPPLYFMSESIGPEGSNCGEWSKIL